MFYSLLYKDRRILLFFAVVFPGVAGCTASITPGNLLKQMLEGTEPLIVDVRSQDEYDRDHVPGALHARS
ncbi:MAG: rhodanese-like domain-containing protein [Betaproteobacteria bacterium]